MDLGFQSSVLSFGPKLIEAGSKAKTGRNPERERPGRASKERRSWLVMAESAGGAKTMRATRTRAAARRTRLVKRTAKRTAKPAAAKAVAKPATRMVVPPEPVLYKLCKPGWAVIVERIPNALGTRFVCPFCPKSHRVPGPVRGFKKMRHAQWGRLRRVEE